MGDNKGVVPPRVDARDKVTGRAIYTEDLPSPYGTAYCAILRSPYSHARIRSINTEKAERLPGVLAVLTREHLSDTHLRGQGSGQSGSGPQPLIAIDKVRYDGDPVAAVAAESLALCQYALSLIEVTYDELPAVFDPRDAIAPGAPLVHEPLGSNVQGEYRWGWGDVELGFSESDHIFEDIYLFPSVAQYPIENIGGCLAEFRDDHAELTAPIQHPFGARSQIAELFGLEPEQVRIRMPYIGGGFGAKDLKPGHLIALWLAQKTGRPIQTLPSVEENIRSIARHQMVYKVRTGLKKDGSLWAQEIELLVDEGAYARGMSQARLAVAGAWGPYRIPHTQMVGRSIFTNRIPAGSFRSNAKAQVTWGYECNLDSIARQMGIDPMELRVKNFMRRGDIIVEETSPLDADYDDLLRKAVEVIGWDGCSTRVGPAAAEPPTGTSRARGRGLGTAFRHGYQGGSNCYVTATLDARGKVKILHSAAEVGMGLYSVLVRVAAQTLGIPGSEIAVSHPDTEHPYSNGVGSSRDTVCMGVAVQNACEDLKHELLRVAAMSKGGNPEEWRLTDGRLWHGERDFALGELLSDGVVFSGVVMGKGAYITPHRDNPFLGVVPHWEVGVGAAEVEVDLETGEVHLLKYATVGDVGKAIQPEACKGQLDGAAVMGLGNTLYEEMVYQDGQLLNGDPLQYRLPLLHDLPEGFYSVMVENGDGPGPYGAKGMGQTAVSPVAPAVANAVYEATGVRIKELPITPEKILRGLGKL